MYHVGICDDEPVPVRHLKRLVSEILTGAGISHRISTFANVHELEAYLADTHMPVDLLLLNILMEGKNGMDFARELNRSDLRLPFVFLSNTIDYALEGYHLNALAYLIKPIHRAELEKVLHKAWKSYQKQTVLLPCAGQTVSLTLNDLLYIEIYGKLLSIHMTDGTISQASMPLISVLELLPPEQFIRCHKSYIVSLPGIQSICRYSIELKNHEQIPVSKSRYAEVRAALLQWTSRA